MSVTLAEVFDRHLGQLKFDSKLAKAVYQYQIGYVNSNREHLEFFGSNLLGVHVVRFKDSDVLRLFEDVLDVDFSLVAKDLLVVDDINQDFKISSDPFNLTCMYLIHRFLTSSSLDEHKRRRAAHDCGLLFFYRTIAALISDRFRYPADPKLAQAAYARLSNKYLIKRLGSWHKVMDYRANALIDVKGIHYKKLVSFDSDLAIVYAINDSQGRIRDIMKGYYGEMVNAQAGGEKIGVSSSTYFDAEGEENVKEKIHTPERHVQYIRTVLSDPHSFVKDDLVSIITHINTNSNVKTVRMMLMWLSTQYEQHDTHTAIDDFVSLVVIHSFYLINNTIQPRNLRDYPMILTSLKGLYLSSRSTDPDLMRIREMGESLVKKATHDRYNSSLTMATRTAIILYISLRALVGANT